MQRLLNFIWAIFMLIMIATGIHLLVDNNSILYGIWYIFIIIGSMIWGAIAINKALGD